MFGIGETELIIIVVFAFIVFGPDKLPGMGRTIGRALRQFREAQEDFTQVVQAEVVDPLNNAMNEPSARKQARDAAAAVAEDSDLEGTTGASRRQETFAERKARLQAERAARDDAAGATAADEAAGTATSAGSDDDGDADVTSSVETTLKPEAKEAPAMDAASLYALSPQRAAADETVRIDGDVDVADGEEVAVDK